MSSSCIQGETIMVPVRAKFFVSEVSYYPDQAKVVLRPVTANPPGSENEAFFRWTPAGEITIYSRTEIADRFQPGQAFYIDFTPAE